MSRFAEPNYSWARTHWERPKHTAGSVYGGAGGWGTISSSSSAVTTRTKAYRSPLAASSMFALSDERETMHGLNQRLASYLETVRSLEQANSNLELQIHEALEKRGPEVKDYSRYDNILEDLRKQVLGMISGNENLYVRISTLNSEAEDLKMKVEIERKLRQPIESDIVGLKNLLDKFDVMKLEIALDALSEDLILLKKTHKEDVLELRSQIDQSGFRVEVDTPTGEDLGQIIGEIRTKFEKMALKNQEELEACHVLKVSEVEAEVAENTTALQVAQTERKEKYRLMQSLEIEIKSQRSQKASLEDSLQDTEMHYNMEIDKYNNIILQLEAELTELRSNIQLQTQEFDMLLSLKMKLEAEIATYRGLLDEGDFK